jgi:membrane glycosyltransferase
LGHAGGVTRAPLTGDDGQRICREFHFHRKYHITLVAAVGAGAMVVVLRPCHEVNILDTELFSRPDTTVATGTQSLASLNRRRPLYLTLVLATLVALTIWLGAILAPGGGVLAALMLVAFLIYAPWVVVGFWNSLLGLALVRGAGDPLARVMPAALRSHATDQIAACTAIVMTMRDEEPTRALAHLRALMASIEQTSEGAQFDYFVLSDSSRPDIVAAEERAIAAWRAELSSGGPQVVYRRRAENIGFKGGNVHDFCERWGGDHELMVLLDIDSLMSGETVLRLVRIMQANPRIGIVQSLAVGLPNPNPFARLFQFGHRHGMRLFVLGAGWWQGDRCQFWGHNAAIRVAPFTRHCGLPVLPGGPPLGGHIICHDQVEAAMMYRAGYAVCLLPVECGSYEGNPPSLPDYLHRNSRWCQGNLQNLRLIGAYRGEPLSVFHLAFMAQKFIGGAAVALFAALAAAAAVVWPADTAFPADAALAFYAVFLLIIFTPKLLSVADTLTRASDRYGGAGRLLAGAAVELGFSFILMPVSFVASAGTIAALMTRHALTWNGQRRDGARMSALAALSSLWWPTAFGVALLAALALAAPGAIPWFMPFIGGLLLAVPFTIVAGSPAVAAWMMRNGICASPEELDPPAEVAAVMPVLMRGD